MAIVLAELKGLADSKWSGIAGSVSACVGLDIHSTPGLTKVHQKLTKNSGSTVDGFVKVALAASNGYSFWFSADSGKIWARTTGGAWSLAYTTSAGAGASTCLGAIEYNGYIYWATQSRLHRIAIADADDTWASVTANFATFAVTNASWHPMAIQDLTLFIGDGNQVASVDASGTFNNNALDIKTPHQIKCMIAYEWDLLIGTYNAVDSVNKTEVIRWDTVAPSWDSSDPIEEPGINAFIRDDNYVYVNAGLSGSLYFYNGEKLEPYKRVPGTYTSTAYGLVNPNASASFKGVPVFGFSNGTGNPAPEGVYSLGSYSRDYPKVLDLSFPISTGVTSAVEIGAILVLGFDLMVSWKDSTAAAIYGVDAIDYSNKYASAYFETRMLFQAERDIPKTLANISTFYNSLPASTGITMSYSINGAAYVDLISVTNAEMSEVRGQLSAGGVGSLQVKVSFTVATNNAPTMECLAVDLE